MASRLVQKLTGVRDLKRILETTVRELGDTFNADTCQVILSNPLDPNVTSICEYHVDDDEEQGVGPRVTVPLVLQGRTFGSVTMSRQQALSMDEVNALRVLLGELGDIIRLAQINDVVQRDTFRETFLVEIGNVMSYSLGIGDALFMVVNILGKALSVSRCLFICTDDAQAGWKCYEFWQQEKVKSCQEYYWPSNDSPFVAQALLSNTPLSVYEGQENSYVSPVQEELRFIGVKSLLGVPLTSSEGTHGCVILQQCDYRRAWTRNEVDMVQNVADKVAEALLKLPAEKRVREPIMQLHQRIVEAPDAEAGVKSSVDVRRALKGALGQQAIPSARAVPKKPKPAPPPPPTPPPPPPPPQEPKTVPPQTEAAAPVAPPKQTTEIQPASSEVTIPPEAPERDLASIVEKPTARGAKRAAKDVPQPKIKAVTSAKSNDALAKPPAQPGDPPSTTEIKEFVLDKAGESAKDSLAIDPSSAPPAEADPYADLDFGDFEDAGEESVAVARKPSVAEPQADSKTTAMDAAPVAVPEETVSAPAAAGVQEASSPGIADLDSIPTPEAAPDQQGWGNLDAIPTPSKGSDKAAGGLKGSMMSRAKAANAASPLMSSLRKSEPADVPAESAPPEPLDEESAKKKLDELMSASNVTSDYIFATPGLDARMLGRIDGWVSQIELKDKYKGGHARPVAEYAVAIAIQLEIKEEDVHVIRQAALVHDLGKLGIAKSVLQKHEENLEPDEYVLKMGHSVAGSQLLESFPDLSHLAPIVHAHHEEIDGEGFPQGLKGDEIPVFARIIAVANGYHELVADKVFGDGLNPEEAQSQMLSEAGKLFDPTIVEALVQAISDNKVPASM